MPYPRLSTLTRVAINISNSGDNSVIAAVAGKRILIHRLWLVAGGATNVTFKDSLASPASMSMTANAGLTLDISDEPWFVTAINAAFVINSTNAVQLSGECAYNLTS